MTNQFPLQYKIADWHHLTKCKSNNSSKFKITVTDIIDDDLLRCILIKVVHPKYGVLFACTLKAGGDLVSNPTYLDNSSYELTPAQILEELYKWGFRISYSPSANLSGTTLDLLMKLQNMGYDKIRVLNTWKYVDGVKKFNWKVVCFKVKENPDWINSGYAPSEESYRDALANGSAINISAISEVKNLDWSWLYNWVGSIDDILKENAEVLEQ